MVVFGVVCILLGALCLVAAAIALTVHWIFQHRPELTSKTGASLVDADHQKNVTKYFTAYGHVIHTKFFKHYTKALYIYTVRDKDYVVKDVHFGTYRQTERSKPIVYLTKFPRFRYINDPASTSDVEYELHGLVLAVFGFFLLLAGLHVL